MQQSRFPVNDEGTQPALEEERLKAILESLLFAAGEPVSLTQLSNALDSVPREDIRRALGEMATNYAGETRGLRLEEIAGGYQLRTPREHALYVRRLLSARPPRLSRPLLETLAIAAYRQPVTRPEIEQLRGVDSGGVLETLIERGLLKIAGRKDAPGRPIVYATTAEFLELFGLKDLESLPDLEEFRELEGLRERPSGENGAAILPVEEGLPEGSIETQGIAEDVAQTQVPTAPEETTVPEEEQLGTSKAEPSAEIDTALESSPTPVDTDADDDSGEQI